MAVLQTVLLVDDDETANFLHTRLLKRLNFATHIAVATNGEEALRYLHKHCTLPDNTTPTHCPDLILLDLKMPVMDGFEFLAEYERNFRKDNNIPVVVLSTSENPADKERVKNFVSVKKYITKPLSETSAQEILADHSV